MECLELIAAAQDALGGLERLRRIHSYHAVARRVQTGKSSSKVVVWRAAGGKIRLEERCGGRSVVRVANGTAGSMGNHERTELLRDARIAPRNMLAHADEHALALRSRPAPDGSWLVSFPSELVLYLFHPATHLCTRLIDLPRRRRIDFSDYRVVDEVATPFTEKQIFGEHERIEDLYELVEYNLDLSPNLFELESHGSA